jgi:hypothetical protein
MWKNLLGMRNRCGVLGIVGGRRRDSREGARSSIASQRGEADEKKKKDVVDVEHCHRVCMYIRVRLCGELAQFKRGVIYQRVNRKP